MADPLDNVPPKLREILDRIPPEPGVYLMKDKKGKIIYIGKAASLRTRVRSYFTRSGDDRAFIALLGRILGDIETLVTGNEKEALLLENTLIKQHQPRFNVKLVDDKNYLVLRLDPAARYPRLEVVRRIGKDGARYFGPYHSATACRAALRVVNRHFKLRTCTDHVLDSRARPCLQYQIKRCDAPCVYPVPKEEYGEHVRDVALFLEGKDQELVTRLRERMKRAAQTLEFERAAAVRDQLIALEKTLEQQRVVLETQRDQDVLGFYREGDRVEIAVLQIRQGKLLGRRTLSFSDQEFPDDEIVSSFLGLYYDLGNSIPDEVLLPRAIEDAQLKADWLRERRGRKVEVLFPRRGQRVRLVELASANAAAAYRSRRDHVRDTDELLEKLKQRLGLRRLPRRIECFDISHLQGSHTVASMVVFVDGAPARAEYRRFQVRRASNDDFASMYEVLSRRLRRSLGGDTLGGAEVEAEAEAAEPATADDTPRSRRWPLPDLLVIDGGKGQLGSVLAAMRDVGLEGKAPGVDVIALAKERETAAGEQQYDRVFLPRAKDPLPLRPNTAEMHLLSHLRDEAHRFAVTYHGMLRRRRTLRSALADVPGIGKQRQRELLRHFGSLKRVREASEEALCGVPGMTRAAAQAVREFFAASAAPSNDDGVAAADAALRDRGSPASLERSGTMRPRRRHDRAAGRARGEAHPAAVDVTEDAAAAELAALTGATPDADDGVDDSTLAEAIRAAARDEREDNGGQEESAAADAS